MKSKIFNEKEVGDPTLRSIPILLFSINILGDYKTVGHSFYTFFHFVLHVFSRTKHDFIFEVLITFFSKGFSYLFFLLEKVEKISLQ